MIKENTQAPSFKLLSTNNYEYALKDSLGKYVVIYFYPKDDTPGCSIEARDFNKLLPKFKRLNCEVFGVSKDSLKSHDKFKDKYKFKFELISDPDEKLCKKFGVIQKKKLYGREFMGIVRSTFILNAKGKVLASWQGVKVNGHVDEVLETLKSL